MHGASAANQPLGSLSLACISQAPQKGDEGQEPVRRLAEELAGRSPVFLSATTSPSQRRGTEPVRHQQMSTENRTGIPSTQVPTRPEGQATGSRQVLRTASGGRPHGEPIIQQPKYLHSHRYTPPGVSYILMLFNLAICPICPMGSRNVPVPEVRSPYTLHAHRMHAEYPLANLDDDVDLE